MIHHTHHILTLILILFFVGVLLQSFIFWIILVVFVLAFIGKAAQQRRQK